MEQTTSETIQPSEREPELPRAHQRFYDRMRRSIDAAVGRRGAIAEKAAEWLLLVPDMFVLLWRLTRDERVSRKHKLLLGGAIVYFISPFDLLPEAILGPIGYLDDLVLSAYVLNKILKDTDPAILRQHWGGQGDVLETIKRLLNAADSMVESKALEKLKRIVRD